MNWLRKHAPWTILAAFIGFHVIVFSGAGAYLAHVAGYDVPFLSHHHKCK